MGVLVQIDGILAFHYFSHLGKDRELAFQLLNESFSSKLAEEWVNGATVSLHISSLLLA